MPVRFRNLSLVGKQLVGFSSLLVIIISLNAFFINRISDLKGEVDLLTQARLPGVAAISDINQITTELRLTQLQLASAADSAMRRQLQFRSIELLDKINSSRDDYESLRAAFVGVSDMAREDAIYAHYDHTWDTYQEYCLTFFELTDANRNREAVELLNGPARMVFDDLSARLTELVTLNREAADLASERAESTYRRTRGASFIIFIASVIVSIGLSLALRRYVIRPVRLLADATEHISEGDLDLHLPVRGKDEISRLAQSFNRMIGALQRARTQTEEQADALRRQAGELRLTNEQLEEKSYSLSRQKAEIEAANKSLEHALVQLRSTQEQLLMKEKMASLGHLVAGVTHELNNPIGAIISSGDVSRRCLARLNQFLAPGANIDDAVMTQTLALLAENIENTLAGSRRVATLVLSLKNFARLDEAEFQSVDIHEGIDNTLVLLGGEIARGISVDRQYGDIPKVACYPGQLNQAFMNILRNAVDSIDTVGTVTIRTRRTEDTVEITIADTGRGIPEEKLARVFDIGFSSSGTRIKMGSGLSSAYSIVQRHDGDISVSSEVGRGTTVAIRLPLR
jgi:signal transduction histidine kinase/HAMP domain-containing protein